MSELSPAAQAVWDAAYNTPEDCPYEHDLAAALRAAANSCESGELALTCIHSIHAIADELETQ